MNGAISMKPVLVWVDDSMGRERDRWVWDQVCHEVEVEAENEFEIMLFGDSDSAIEFTVHNADRIFMFMQDSTRLPGRIIPAWKRLRSMSAPTIGYESHQGDFYTYVIDAYTPNAGVAFAGFSFSEAERNLISDWSEKDQRIVLAKKFELAGYKHDTETHPLALLGLDQLRRWNGSLKQQPSNEAIVLQPLAEELAVLCGARPRHLDALTPRQFEELIATLFKNHGFHVELTARTRDGGYDIVAASHSGLDKETILVEVKHFAPNRPVGVGIVRALYGVKKLNLASKGILVTSSYVSKDARSEFSRVIPWELDFVERDKVIEWCESYLASLLERDETGIAKAGDRPAA